MTTDKKQTLFDPFEERGYWWLPDNSEKKVPGILSFSPADIILDLFGGFGKRTLEQFGTITKPAEIPFIHGQLADMTPCTLYGTTWAGGKPFFHQGEYHEKYTAKGMLLNAIVSNEAEMQFVAADFSLTNLEEWLGEVPFTDTGYEKGNSGIKRFNYSYSFIEPFEIYIEQLESRICATSTFTSYGPGFRTHNLERKAYIRVGASRLQSFDWFQERLVDVQTLLTLLIGDPVFPKRVQLFFSEEDLSKGNAVKLYYSHQYKIPDKEILPQQMFFSFPRIKDSFAGLLRAWFAKREALRNVCALFVGPAFSENLYVEFQFLSFVQALEIYSRQFHVSKYMSDEEYEPTKQLLIAALPPQANDDWKTSFRDGKIKYGNEFSLRRRLRQILCDLEDETVSLVCSKPRFFAEKVAGTRNYYTHYASTLKEHALPPGELYWLAQRLRILLMILLFKELSIDEASIRKQFSEHNTLGQIIQLHLRPDTRI